MWNIFKKSKVEFKLSNGVKVLSLQTQENKVEPTSDGTDLNEEIFVEKPIPWLKKTVRSLLLALIFLTPLFFLPFTAPGDVLALNKQVLIYGLALVSLILWLIMIVKRGRLFLRYSGLEWGVLSIVGAGLLSAIFSRQVYQSFMSSSGFLSLAALALVFLIIHNFFGKEDLGKLIGTFVLGSAVAVLAGTLNLFGARVFHWILAALPKGMAVNNQFNTVGSANSMGVLAVLGLIFLLSRHFARPSADIFSDICVTGSLFLVPRPGADIEQAFGKQGQVPKITRAANIGKNFGTGAAGFIFTFWLLILNWWAAYLALAVGTLVIVLGPGVVKKLTGQSVNVGAKNLVLPLVTLVLSVVLIFSGRFFDLSLSGMVLGRDLPAEVGLSVSGSSGIVKGVAILEPIYGFGEGNFNLAYDKFKPNAINQTAFWNARFGNSVSEAFDLVTEQGFLGLAAFIFLLFCILRRFKNRLSLEAWSVIPAFVSILVVFFLYPFNLVLASVFWFVLAFLAINFSSEENKSALKMDDASLSSVFASLAFVLVLVFGLIGGYLLFQRYAGEVYLAKAARISGSKQTDLDQAVNFLAQAVNFNSNDDLYLSNLGNLLLQELNAALNDKVSKPEEVRTKVTNLTKSIIQVANQLTVTHPNDAANWFNAGVIYENLIGLVNGADQAAVASYQEYLKRAPQDPTGYVKIGGIYVARADNNSAALRNAKAKGQEIKNEEEINGLISKDYSSAEENFKKAINLKNDLAIALYSLGGVYEREGKLKEAIKQLELTRLVDSTNPGLAFELSLLYYRDGQKDNALNEMARAVALFKDYSNARWYLALMLEEKGQIDLAIGQLKEILKLGANKDNQIVQDKLASLEAGKRELPPVKVTSKKPLDESAKRAK